MRHSVTWKPQDEKRWLIPTKQALTFGVCAGLTALTMQGDLPEPLKTGLVVTFGATTAAMFRLYWFPAETGTAPRKVESAKTYSQTLPVLSLTKPADAEPGQPFVWDGWPVTYDELRFFCARIARGYSLGFNTWTRNAKSRDGATQIWSKTVYKEVRKNLILCDYVKSGGVASTVGLLLTEIGRAWCWQVVNNPNPLPPAEFDYKTSGFYPLAASKASQQAGIG